METINPDKLVIFGAGKIGRSFIGQLFSCNGYEVVFIDVYKPVIDELNKKKCYKVIIKSNIKDEILFIRNVRGVHANDETSVINEVATAGILAVSVGSNGLKHIFPLIANGILERYQKFNASPLDIIIAENLRNAGNLFYTELSKNLPENFPVRKMIGAVETSIGKMVPIMQLKDSDDDILKVFAEPYNTLIVSKNAFLNPIPDFKGIAPKDNIKAWVDRKLFIHNMGHSAVAYIGHIYNQEFKYIHEVLEVPEICEIIRVTMTQAAGILTKIYPSEFTSADMDDHINDLISRFRNKALGDTIFRVGCDLNRKLGQEDRFAGIIHLALRNKLPYDKILFALICGCHFRAKDETGRMLKEDVDFVNTYDTDIDRILTDVSGFEIIASPEIFGAIRSVKMRITCLKQKTFVETE